MKRVVALWLLLAYPSMASAKDIQITTSPLTSEISGVRVELHVWPGGADQDVCFVEENLPPNNRDVCLIQYRAADHSIVFPKGLKLSVEYEAPAPTDAFGDIP